jgi:hypothetical protein
MCWVTLDKSPDSDPQPSHLKLGHVLLFLENHRRPWFWVPS